MPASSPITVLHVDDDPAFTDLVATFLDRADVAFEVTTAASAAAGLDVLADEAVDCVVSDHDMPGRDGLDFLAAVREDHPDLPFILFTGKGSEEIASDAISAGVTDYLQKKPGAEQYELLGNRIRNAVEQHRAERAATETKQRLRELAGNTNDVLWTFTADWRTLLFVNDQYERIYGQSVERLETHPESFLDAVHPDDRAAVRDAMQRLSNGESVDVEYRVNEAEDYGRWVWVQGEPVFQGGDVARVVGFSRDVTNRKDRERRLREERAFAESLFESLPDVFYTLDETGDLLRWNDRLLDVTGYTDREVEGMDAVDFFPPEHHAAILDAISEVFETGHAIVDVEIETKAGERIPYELTGARLTGPDGELRGIVGIGRDVSERTAREEALEEFASVVSHDLRNPLSTADGYLDLARETGADEHFERVAESLDRMDRIISDVLWLSREGRGVGSTEPVALADAVRDAWRVVAGEETDADLVVDGALGTVDADRDRLAQLLENLLRNAVEHGGPGVTVRAEATPDGFAVADDGPGVPDDVRDDVFDHGFSTRAAGTGFGLSIVRDIADAHGWTVELAASDRGGARVVVATQ